MSNQVYANMMEVACKQAAGKAICAFPDVCFTPPQTPATPPGVPIPYPNTGMASDTTDGSSSVKISGQEVMLKNKSYFKKSMGDEAGCAPKKGMITSVNRGKVYFNAWSMDVKVEGENVVRHLDLTTHNHASFPGESPTWPFLDEAAFAGDGPCASVAAKLDTHCSPLVKPLLKTQGAKSTLPVSKRKPAMDAMCGDDKCKDALKCVLQPHKEKKASNNCCDGKTTHHLVPSADFIPNAARGEVDSATGYCDVGAPCICAEGDDHNARDPKAPFRLKQHGRIGRKFTLLRNKFIKKNGAKAYTLEAACKLGAQSAGAGVRCPPGCVEEQLKQGHKDMKLKNPAGPKSKMPRISSQNAPELTRPKI